MHFLNKPLLIPILIFIVALLPRIYQLDKTVIYPDEIIWMVRSKEIIFTIKQLNWQYFTNAWWMKSSSNSTEAIGLPLTIISGSSLVLLGKEQSTISLNIFSDVVAARLPLTILSSFFISIFYLLAKQVSNPKVALFSAVLLALDPVHIALSRWVMQDSLLTLFTFLTIWVLITKKIRHRLVLTILSLVTSFLTKPQGVIAISPALVTIFTRKNVSRTQIISFLFVIFMICILISLIWPAGRDYLVQIFWEYPLRQFLISGQGMRNFFLGHISFNPPPYYYLFQIVTRVPIFIIIGLLIFPFYIYNILQSAGNLKKFINKHIPRFAGFTFFVIFLLIVSFSAKKLGARYILPLWPWIYLASAWSLFQISNLFKKKFLKFLFLSVIIFSSFILVIRYFPDYYLYYNSLIGGPTNAQKYDLVGLCSGAKESAEYINIYYPTVQTISLIGCGSTTLPYYYSKKIINDYKSADIVIVENSFKQLLPDDEKIQYYDHLTPVHIVEVQGAILARIYLQNSIEVWR